MVNVKCIDFSFYQDLFLLYLKNNRKNEDLIYPGPDLFHKCDLDSNEMEHGWKGCNFYNHLLIIFFFSQYFLKSHIAINFNQMLVKCDSLLPKPIRIIKENYGSYAIWKMFISNLLASRKFLLSVVNPWVCVISLHSSSKLFEIS